MLGFSSSEASLCFEEPPVQEARTLGESIASLGAPLPQGTDDGNRVCMSCTAGMQNNTAVTVQAPSTLLRRR